MVNEKKMYISEGYLGISLLSRSGNTKFSLLFISLFIVQKDQLIRNENLVTWWVILIFNS